MDHVGCETWVFPPPLDEELGNFIALSFEHGVPSGWPTFVSFLVAHHDGTAMLPEGGKSCRGGCGVLEAVNCEQSELASGPSRREPSPRVLHRCRPRDGTREEAGGWCDHASPTSFNSLLSGPPVVPCPIHSLFDVVILLCLKLGPLALSYHAIQHKGSIPSSRDVPQP